MGYTNDYLTSVGSDIAADDAALTETRGRLALVRKIAIGFRGAHRTYASGSLAHHTINDPVTDGDGGVVLNRSYYPQLGPDGGGEAPNSVAADLCALLGPEIRNTYPNARCGTSKRGPKITFGEPVNGQDPSVDLVLALTRREGSGLWIPNLHMDRWEASDPEKHVELLNGGTVALRRTRRRVIRLAKAWNKQWTLPGLSSFHLSALALEHVTPGMSVATGLHAVFDEGATFLATGCNTPDPAGVSNPLKLMKGVTREAVVQRLRAAADAIADALAHDDDETAVQSALHKVFRNYVEAPASDQLAAVVAEMRPRTPITTVALGLSAPAVVIPPTRAYGGRRAS
ncbi:hypothetical protein ACFWY5_11435 [Nonomuraea sp. NPDC059007]|uniref:hypothetical protein n=1 Tax=Nonomuraea sp. NPDC059007 TaxID=3346692 RepID=UPI00368C7D49